MTFPHPGGYEWLSGLSASLRLKGHRVNSWSGHMPQLQARFPVGGMCTRGNQSMYLLHIDVSLPLSLLLFPSL